MKFTLVLVAVAACLTITFSQEPDSTTLEDVTTRGLPEDITTPSFDTSTEADSRAQCEQALRQCLREDFGMGGMMSLFNPMAVLHCARRRPLTKCARTIIETFTKGFGRFGGGPGGFNGFDNFNRFDRFDFFGR